MGTEVKLSKENIASPRAAPHPVLMHNTFEPTQALIVAAFGLLMFLYVGVWKLWQWVRSRQ